MHPRYRSILRLLFANVMQSDLTVTDLRYLSSELRRGRLSDELAYMIEQASAHLGDTKKQIGSSEELDAAERWVKEKRVSKPELMNIMLSVNPEAAISSSLSAKGMLNAFFESATVRQTNKLMNLLQAAGGSDPFLKGISER